MQSPRSPCRLGAALLASLILSSCGMSAITVPTLVANKQLDTTASLDHRFRVLIWNVHKETGPEFVTDLKRLLDSGRVDLVLLQEAAISNDRPIFHGALGNRSWVLSANLHDSIRKTDFGVLTASRATAVEHRAILSSSGEPVLGTRKPALLTRYLTGTETLTVVNVHALNFSPRIDGFRQQLSDIQEVLGQFSGPCMVAGDFNTWSSRKQFITDSILGPSGLRRVDFGDLKRRQTKVFGHPLDQIYFRNRSLDLDTQTLRVHDGIESSDHVPLEAEFSVRSSIPQ